MNMVSEDDPVFATQRTITSIQYYQLKNEHDKQNDGHIVQGQSISKYRHDKNPCN